MAVSFSGSNDAGLKPHNELSEVMTFGKYKGHTKEYVLDLDPSYLLWAVVNIPWFKLGVELVRTAEALESERLEETDYVLFDDSHWSTD